MFRRDKSFLAQRFCCLATKCTYHWIVCWHQFQLPDNNSYTPLLSGQFRFFAKVTGALLTRVTVVPTQPIKTLNLLRSERTVYAVSNSWMETKQAVLPLSAPVSTSILLCFGNRHNHITVFDETIFVSSMTLYQQAGRSYIQTPFLRCKMLVGIVPNPLCTASAGCRLRICAKCFYNEKEHRGLSPKWEESSAFSV